MEQLTGAVYLGMGEREKSDQRYTMMAVETEPQRLLQNMYDQNQKAVAAVFY